MNTDCVNCKHARLWTDKEQFEYIERMYKSIGRMPCRADHYICDKIPEGTEWTEDGKTYTYDGYSLNGENYDEVFHCFKPQESEVKECSNCAKSWTDDCPRDKCWDNNYSEFIEER